MRYAVAFGFLGLMLLADAGPRILGVAGWASGFVPTIEIAAAIACLAVAWMYGLAASGREVERAFGGVGPLGIALRPYQVVAGAVLRASARLGRERPFDEVAPGLFLGRVPFARDLGQLREAGIGAVVQLCAEFPNLSAFRAIGDVEVLAVPILDGLPPTAEQFEAATAAVARRRSEGKAVLIHCAQGHGRGGTIAAAALLALGLASGPEEALRIVREARPGARPSRSQVEGLRRYHAARGRRDLAPGDGI